MESVLQYILGVLIVAVGIGLSIGLHEIGHLVPAKLFGVKVTQYMVGFGPTIWSRRKGETEYGIKALPLGGYVSMIGMFPPTRPGEAPHASSTGFFQQLSGEQEARAASRSAAAVEAAENATDGPQRRRYFNALVQDARQASAETIGAGEEDRTFYRLAVWKRMIVMLGGPAMNLLIAVVLYGVLLIGIGIPQNSTTLASVNECAIPAGRADQTCGADDPTAPGAAAGLQPGDTMVSLDGVRLESWEQASAIIRESPRKTMPMVVMRDGEEVTVTLTPMLSERYVTDDRGQVVEDESGNPVTHDVGFVGISPAVAMERQPATAVLPAVGDNIVQMGGIIINLPQRLFDVAQAAFGPGERDPNGPMSVVGVGRIAGEVSALEDVPIEAKAQTLVGILASLNVALFVFNLIPLMPLDGGHVAAAAWEGIRRWFAKIRGKRDPGPVDAAKLMPLTFTVAILLGGMSLLLIYADIVKPVNLFG